MIPYNRKYFMVHFYMMEADVYCKNFSCKNLLVASTSDSYKQDWEWKWHCVDVSALSNCWKTSRKLMSTRGIYHEFSSM